VAAQSSERRSRHQGNEVSRACRHQMRRPPLPSRRHLVAETLICRDRMTPGRLPPSECSRPQCPRVRKVLKNPVPLRPRSAAAIISDTGWRHRQITLHPLRREELIPDSMRKTTLANLETKTLKAFRNIFAHHKNAHATTSDWVSYIPVELHTQVRARIRRVVDPKTDKKRFTPAQVDKWQDMDVLTVLDVLIEPKAAEIVDGNSLVVALENVELVPSEFFVSHYYETLEHQLSTIYRQFMLVYEECRHEESTTQVKAMERAFKRPSEGQRLTKLIRAKNIDGSLPRSVGEYMNAAEDLAAEAEAALRKARRRTDAAGGKFSVSGSGARKRHQASSYKQNCPGCGSFDHVYKDCFSRSHPYFNKDPSILSMHNLPLGFDTTICLGDGISKNVTWIQLCRRMTAGKHATKEVPAGRFCWTVGQISGQRAVGIAQPRSLPTQSRRFLGPSCHARVYRGTSTRSSDR
jgi:hypothetical protein